MGLVMRDMKIYLPDDLEREFKKQSMEAFGYGRGSISKAATEAIQRWTSEHEKAQQDYPPPKDPVKALRGLLKDVKESSIELQHEARKIRARKVLS